MSANIFDLASKDENPNLNDLYVMAHREGMAPGETTTLIPVKKLAGNSIILINIRDYGAISSPIPQPGLGQEVPTDCADAIEAACAAASVFDGSVVVRAYVPEGRWMISRNVTVAGVELYMDSQESVIFCNNQWTGGNMLTLQTDATLRNVRLDGGGYCDYAIQVDAGAENVLIKDCQTFNATMEDINFIGNGEIDGGIYDEARTSFLLYGNVTVKNAKLFRIGIFGNSGIVTCRNVETGLLASQYGAKIMWWEGRIESENTYEGTEWARFFGVFLKDSNIRTTLLADANTELIGCTLING